MTQIKFTQDELFVIEKMADDASLYNHNRFMKLAELFFLNNAKETLEKDKLGKQCIRLLEEIYKSDEVLQGIRDKCEKWRNEK